MSTEGGTRAVVAALLANTGIAITKFLAWILTGASSMLAEGIHSVADAGNQGLLLLGGKRATRAPTEQHPFGFGRERYVYAFIVSIVLFTVGGLFALYEAYHKYEEITGDHASDDNLLTSKWKWVPIVVLSAAIVMESFSFRTAIIESNRARGNTGWVAFVRRAKAPELPVILLEDLAALVGLVFALAGVGLSLLTQDLIWDVVGTTAIGILLVVVAIVLAIETKSLLLGESASPENRRLIEEGILGADSVLSIIYLRTLHVGPDEVLVACKIAVAPTESAQEIATTIDAAEERVRTAVPEASHIFIEPDIRRQPVT